MAVFQGGGPDQPQLVLGSMLDYFTSALLAYGVAAALFKRERSGVGQYLSLSLLRSALTIQAGRFVWAESAARPGKICCWGTSARSRRDADNASAELREEGRGSLSRLAGRRALVCDFANWLSDGRFGPVRRVPPADVVYDDEWGQPYCDQ